MTLDQWLFWWMFGLMLHQPWNKIKDDDSIFSVFFVLVGIIITLVAYIGATITFWGIKF